MAIAIKPRFLERRNLDRRKNGEFCPMLISINAVSNAAGILTHYVAIATDISHQKKTEQELKQLAYYDALTNLPNRALFKDRLEQELISAERKKNRLALFFLDLDHFKNINDTLGHWAGDFFCRLRQPVFKAADLNPIPSPVLVATNLPSSCQDWRVLMSPPNLPSN